MALGYSQDIIDDAGEVGSMFGSAIMESMGYENKEKAVDRVLKNGDWTTEEGREAMLAEVGAIDPDAHNELQKQMLEAEQTKSLTEQTRISRENAILERVTAMNGPELIRKFQSDEGPNGQHQAIAKFLRDNLIVTDPEKLAKITTTAQAAAEINSTIEKGAREWVNNMYKYVGDMQTAYIKRGVYEIAGLSDIGVYTEEVSQTLTQPALVETPKVDDEKFYKEGENYNANASQFEVAWAKVGGAFEILNGLNEVKRKLFQVQLEFTLAKDKKDYEDAEDAVNSWIGGLEILNKIPTPFGVGGRVMDMSFGNLQMRTTSPAYDWFRSHSPLEFKEFQNNPVAYYNKHRAAIESAANYKGVDNTDLFANIPFNLDEE